MTKSFIKIFSVLALGIAFTGCVKKDTFFSYDQSTPNRKQVVKIANGGGDIVVIARDVNPTIDTFGVIDLRREPNDNAQLNTALTVKLVKDPTLISDYNTANGTAFVELPASAYTLLGDLNNITFQPGQDIVQVKIRLNKAVLDLSQQYALGYAIADAGTGAVFGVLGFLSAVGSIPLFIASGRNKRKAMNVSAYFEIQQNPVARRTGLICLSSPALSIKINF